MKDVSPDGGSLTTAVNRLLERGAALQAAEVAPDGRVRWANAALQAACGGDLVGLALEAMLTPASYQALGAWLGARAHSAADPVLLQFVPAAAEPFSLHAFIEPTEAGGFVLAGEPPWQDHRSLESRLSALNGEMASLSREHARQAQRLSEALTELRSSHWHLRKIADVLPMCMACRAVRTGPQSWQEVASFLVEHADFLSHGYCGRCAAALDVGPVREPER